MKTRVSSFSVRATISTRRTHGETLATLAGIRTAVDKAETALRRVPADGSAAAQRRTYAIGRAFMWRLTHAF